LQKGGNSVDTAIATMLCESVICLDLTGLGGGFLMTIYNRNTNFSISINARKVAQAASNKTIRQ
jgi:gamma-glutamyltranspeptidase/glutathione hydrolase/leukotriene-C4 hydrolase